MRSESHWKLPGLRSRLARIGLALTLCALLPLQGALLAAPGKAEPQKGKPADPAAMATSVWSGNDSKNLAAKIDPAVADAFTRSSQVTYLVKMRTRADVQSAAGAARQGALPAQAALKGRTAVINSLQGTAATTQRSLLADLEKERLKGSVARVQPYWVANIVVVTSTRAVMEQVAKRGDVEKVLANGEIFLVGGDKVKPRSQAQDDGVKPLAVEWNIERVGAPAVWEQFGIDGTGAVVASLDTGVEGSHPALAAQYRGFDPATGSFDHTYSWFDVVNGQASPYDDHGHGTHTTGTMVGRDAAGVNEIGVAPGAKWIGVKILSAFGGGSIENILAAGQWILAPGGDPSKAPDVVNNSWGGGPGVSEWFRDIVIAWRAAGIVPIFAAGNDGPGNGSIAVPANYPESIAVGATDVGDNLASFSGRGPSPYGEMKPELSAPGVNVRSAVPGGGYQGGWNGTSMAAPHVAGAVALLRQADAALTVDEIELILTMSADPATNAQYPNVPNNGFGHGILNTFTAVGMVASGIGSVSGRVLQSGDDLDAAVIHHTPLTEAYRHTDTVVMARVTDNIAVTAVALRFRMPGMRWWGIVDMERLSGDHRDGMYTGTIPSEIAAGDQVEYYIQAMDFGGNSAFHGTSRHPHRITLIGGITPGYAESFEGSILGWIHGGDGDSWQFGEPTSGPNAARTGSRVAATNLAGNYPDNAFSYLISPPIDLSGGAAALRFYHWYDLESFWDYGYVLVTGDGGENWQVAREYTGMNGGYQEVILDLAPFAGNPAVFVAFVLVTDSSVTRPGWYIDDVSLYRDETPPDAPTNLMAQASPTGSIMLDWDNVTAGDFSHYSVYRSATAGSGYALLGTTGRSDFVDASPLAGTNFYVVTASDTFGNESAPSNEASATAPTVDTRFFDDMEAGPGTWTLSSGANPWQWGVPIYGPSGAASGMNVWGTRLAGDYENNTNASLISPPINLSGLTTAALQFAHWYSLERNWDFGRVEISTNGGSSWSQLAQYTSPSAGGTPVGWESPLIDLTAFVGQTVQIRFRLTSDSSVVYAGWYIDDVRVAGTTAGGTRIEMGLEAKIEKPALKNGKKPAGPVAPKLAMPKGSGSTYRIDRTIGGGSIQPSGVRITALPVADATVTVVETGRVVRTDPVSGAYSITMPAGHFTLRADAYGFYPVERLVEVIDGANVSANFMLTAMPRGTILGQVIDRRTGAPIADARVRVVEDGRVAPVTTNASGHFSLDVLEGSYTLELSHRSYYPASLSVTVPGGGSTAVSVELTPFVGMPGEIGYDDGVGENAWAFFAAGNGWAVRMTPERPGQTTFVTGAKVFLWDTSWPSPGGNSFRAAIFAAAPDGKPGAMLAGPVRVTGGIRGAWNEVDFSSFGVAVTGDFYVAYIQDADYPDTPGLGFDDTPPAAGRTWQFISGSFAPWDLGGDAMIRALVRYAVGAPTITAPADGTFTKEPAVNVTGRSPAGTVVTLYANGMAAAEATPNAAGQFAATLTLAEGEYALTATATVPGDEPGSGTTDPSDPVHLVVDMTPPALLVTSPADGARQNHRLLTISGQATDNYLAGVTVNGTAAPVGADGHFTVEIIGREGENLITVIATDRAGNATTVTRTMLVDSQAPVLSGLQPATDRTLVAGESLTVSFTSEPGLALAAFKIVLGTAPTGSSGQVTLASLEPGEMAMTETAPGQYTATWTVPNGLSAEAAYVQFRAVDSAGNTTRATAPGVLRIQASHPTAVITGPSSGATRQMLQFDGTASSSPNGAIAAYRWTMGDGKVYTTPMVSHAYSRTGTFKVTLTVTDTAGATATTEVAVVITRTGTLNP